MSAAAVLPYPDIELMRFSFLVAAAGTIAGRGGRQHFTAHAL
jgi:hypothetical protein